MRIHRQIGLAIAAFTASIIPATASFPEKPVVLVVNGAPGGAGDVLGRLLGHQLSVKWGQPVVVENKSGAGGMLSTSEMLKSPANGYFMYLTDASISTNPVFRRNPPPDPRSAFLPVGLLALIDFKLVVHPSTPVQSVSELITHVKGKPGGHAYSSPGIGSPHYNIAQLFNHMAGLNAVHVPYRGTPAAILAVVSNRSLYSFGAFQTVAAQLKAGELRALASTRDKRNDSSPELPTIGETVNGFSASSFWAMFVRAGTPADIHSKIAADVTSIMQTPAFQEKVRDLGLDPVGSSPVELASFLDTEIKKWQALPEGVIERQ
jgi:tripartite-type tricarboxylate transporter receptor subunit TctC